MCSDRRVSWHLVLGGSGDGDDGGDLNIWGERGVDVPIRRRGNIQGRKTDIDMCATLCFAHSKNQDRSKD